LNYGKENQETVKQNQTMTTSYQIIPTGRVWVDPGGPFGLVPRLLWKKYQIPNEQGLLPMDLNSLLIYSDGKSILVDTGLGDKLDQKAAYNWGLEYPQGTLLENLATFGVQPRDVDIVINTHLHSDHCGGNTRIVDGKLQPTFPRARHLVQRMEWADAMNPNVRTRNTYLKNNFLPIWTQGLFHFLRGDTQVTNNVRAVITPGHTPGHQSIIIETEKRPVIFLGDLASYAVNMERSAWVTAYDVEPLETITTKQYWQSWALKHDAFLVFEHDTTLPLGRLVRNEKGRLQVLGIN
jgi:glyoxylase-like metal-dependent hydrolase (beta-lactamase superfamily II)